MAESFVRFIVHCGTCGEQLSASSLDDKQVYVHDRPLDCAEGRRPVEVPTVTISQLSDLFKAPAKKASAPAKKAAKK